MKTFFCLFFLIIGIVFLIGAIWLLILSLGYRKSKTARTTAYLVEAKHIKNIYTRTGRIIKDSVDVKYEYSVKGTRYQIERRFTDGRPENVPQQTKVIYQKMRPSRAYLDRAPIPVEPVLCAAAFLLAAVFVGCSMIFLG